MEAYVRWDLPVRTVWKYLKETKNARCTLEMMQSIYSVVKIAGTNGFILPPQQGSPCQKNCRLFNGKEMSILLTAKRCPKCESLERYRIRRSLWMRLIPKTKYYLCEHCDGKFISISDSLSFYWPFGEAVWGALPPLHGSQPQSKLHTLMHTFALSDQPPHIVISFLEPKLWIKWWDLFFAGDLGEFKLPIIICNY